MDCDVEAPNAGLFLNPVLDTRKDVGVLIPKVDEAIRTYCGKCAEVCQFHAIAVIGNRRCWFSPNSVMAVEAARWSARRTLSVNTST